MRSRIALVVAIVLGIIAALAVSKYLSDAASSTRGGDTDKIRIVSASRTLSRGSELKQDYIVEKEVSPGYVSRRNIAWNDRFTYVNKTVKRRIGLGEPIFKDDFESLREVPFSAKLIPGARALTIRVDEISGVANRIKTNDRVDIIGSFSQMGGSDGVAGGLLTHTLLTNVRVLAVGAAGDYKRSRSTAARRYGSVTLSVTQREAELLTFTQAQGRITLTLREPGDALEDEESAPITSSEFPDAVRKAKAERKAKMSEAPKPGRRPVVPGRGGAR